MYTIYTSVTTTPLPLKKINYSNLINIIMLNATRFFLVEIYLLG